MPRVTKTETFTDAKNNPVIIKTALESNIGEETIALAARNLDDDVPLVEPTSERFGQKFYDELAFMEEEIVVMLHTLDRNDAKLPFIQVWNNNLMFCFVPNTEQTVRRKFVNELARKNIVFDEERIQDSEGAVLYVYNPSASQRYRFDIISDNSPHSAKWAAQLRQRI